MQRSSTLWQSLPHFNLPSAIIANRLTLSPSALCLLVVLCHRNHKPSTSGEFSSLIDQNYLKLRAGLSRPSLLKATIELRGHQLVSTDHRAKRGVTRYTMLNPEDASVLSVTPRGRSLYFSNHLDYFPMFSTFVTNHEEPWSLASLLGSELAVYIAIVYEASMRYWREHTYVPLRLSDVRVRSGLVNRTADKALDLLEERSLVYLSSDAVQLCDPRTGMPFFNRGEFAIEDVGNYRQDGRTAFFTSPWTEEETRRMIEACIPGADVTRERDELRTLCVFHSDTKPSLYLNIAKRTYYCHGCKAAGTFPQFIQRVAGRTPAQAVSLLADIRGASFREPTGTKGVSAVYVYRDRDGNPIKRKLRYPDDHYPKYLWHRMEDGWQVGLKDTPSVLYNLPQVLKASTVAIVEGEKDADRLDMEWLHDTHDDKHTRIAVTTMGASGDWEDKFADDLKGKRVILMPDNDEAGRRCGDQILASLCKRNIQHKVIDFQPYGVKDVSDFLDVHSSSELAKLMGPEWVAQRTFTEETTKVTEF
jgi:5S rRNA maturation endonuclease (ribonuclease M5)